MKLMDCIIISILALDVALNDFNKIQRFRMLFID